MFGLNRKRNERLTEKGHAFLDKGDFDAALRVAERLEKRRFTSAFELAALAHAGKGDLEAAVAVLERGAEKVSDVWLNWQLLGNYRSDLERYDLAEEAYECAMGCPGAWPDSVRLNRAILANRRERFSAALGLLDAITGDALRTEVAATRASALNGLGRFADARDVGVDALEQADDDVSAESLDVLANQVVKARLALGDSTDLIKAFAIDVVTRYGPGDLMLTRIRELDGDYSDSARNADFVVLHAQPDASVTFFDLVTRRRCQPQVAQGHDRRHLFGPRLLLQTLQ